MIQPERLADRFREAAILLESQGPVAWALTLGELTWQRADDWEHARDPRLHIPEPLDDEDDERARTGRSDEEEERRRLDAAASAYKSELSKLTERLQADMARMSTIIEICCPSRPKHLQAKDLLVAQVEADGWCGSCWRHDQHLVPITLRSNGDPYYRSRCKPCGEWRREHNQDPPLAVLEIRHSGKRLTTAAVARVLAR